MLLDLYLDKRLIGFHLSVKLTCQAGILVLFGPSGSGKSLTLQCLAGILQPDHGWIRLDSNALYDSTLGILIASQYRCVGYVPQFYALFPHMSVEENIAFGLRRQRRSEARKVVADLVEMLHLSGLNKRHPRELSGGQQQRVALARALAVRPRLLLLDEPFSALDAGIRDILRKDLAAAHVALGTSMVLVTHDIKDTYSLADTVAVFRDGRVLQVGSPLEVFQRPANAEVAHLTGSWNILPGKTVETSGKGCIVDLGGAIIKARSVAMASGDPALVCLRPGDIRLIVDGDGTYFDENIVPCEIRSVALQDNSYSVEVALSVDSKPSAHVLVPAWWWQRSSLSVGSNCSLAIAPEAINVFWKGPPDA